MQGMWQLHALRKGWKENNRLRASSNSLLLPTSHTGCARSARCFWTKADECQQLLNVKLPGLPSAGNQQGSHQIQVGFAEFPLAQARTRTEAMGLPLSSFPKHSQPL